MEKIKEKEDKTKIKREKNRRINYRIIVKRRSRGKMDNQKIKSIKIMHEFQMKKTNFLKKASKPQKHKPKKTIK